MANDQEYKNHYDVVIVGAGLAGLSLARQLSLMCEKKILLLEKLETIPSDKQKYGESLVQVGGYYFSKVLDLEEHLLRRHYLKYNLRFHWKTPGRDNDCFEDYNQAYIRTFSNICTYQLDRNVFEGEILKCNLQNPNFTLCTGVTDLDADIADEGPHTISFKTKDLPVTCTTSWVVDTTGRSKFLARQLKLTRKGEIRHASTMFWVEGLVDIERLTEQTHTQRRLKPDRAALGHTPAFLATNHFFAEGLWFWVIPLHGKTSLAIVYDKNLFPADEVSTHEKLMQWVCREFPLFARDLPHRKVLHKAILRDFSHDCEQTIHASGWAMSGEAGRFTDPLYSPGSDFIAIHNTLICDAILTEDAEDLAEKCRLYEILMRSFYTSLVPTFATSYDSVGQQESFILKYTWELSVYFTHFVFPFINDLLTDRQFIISFLGKFSRLGKINHNLHSYISAYYQWKKTQPPTAVTPRFHDFASLEPLRRAESAFYDVGVTVDEARNVLDSQLANLTELAHFIIAYINADVAGDPAALENRSFVEAIDLKDCVFDVAAIRAGYAQCAHDGKRFEWSFDLSSMEQFQPARGDDDAQAEASRQTQ